MTDAAVEEFGRLDILVNNAGVRVIVPFLEQTLDQWQWMLDVMLTGPMLCSQAAIPHMLEIGRGKIVNVGSVTGIIGLTKRAAYAAAKAGLHGLTRALAYELSSQGIWVNAVAPGLLETPMNTAYFQDEQFMDLAQARAARSAAGASRTRSATSSSSWPRMNRTTSAVRSGTWTVAGSRARATEMRRIVTVGPRQVRASRMGPSRSSAREMLSSGSRPWACAARTSTSTSATTPT